MCLCPDPVWPREVWLCGHLSVGTSGAWLHNLSGLPGAAVTAEVRRRGSHDTLHRTSLTDLRECVSYRARFLNSSTHF